MLLVLGDVEHNRESVGTDARVCTYNPVTVGDCCQLMDKSSTISHQSRQSAIKMCLLGWEVFICSCQNSGQHCHQSMAHPSHLGR